VACCFASGSRRRGDEVREDGSASDQRRASSEVQNVCDLRPSIAVKGSFVVSLRERIQPPSHVSLRSPVRDKVDEKASEEETRG
jgi:hypothetical protein